MEILKCPNCEDFVIIEEINCGIFRHAVYIDTFKQVPPHTSKNECIALVDEKKIYGCGKPFRYQEGKLVICEYI